MCMPKAPKIPAPVPLAPRQAAQPVSQAAGASDANDQLQRRIGFANMILTPKTGMAPASTTTKTLLGA